MNTDEIKKIELEMLKELKLIADNRDIKFYMAYGSALGAVREHGFIEWDTDIDIVVEYTDYDRLCDALDQELSSRYVLSSYRNNPKYDSLKARVHENDKDHRYIHIDIFPLIGMSKNYTERVKQIKKSRLLYRLFYYKMYNNKLEYNDNILKKIISYLLKLLLALVPKKLIVKLHENINLKYSVNVNLIMYNYDHLRMYNYSVSPS